MTDPEHTSNNPSNANLYPQLYDYSAPDRSNVSSGVHYPPPQDVNYYNPPSYSEPLVYNSNPIYPGQAIPQSQVFINDPQFPPPQPIYSIQPVIQNRFGGLSVLSCLGCCFITFLMIQFIFIIICINAYWFTYCYWDFSLTHRDGNYNRLTYDYGTIKGLYNDVCDPDLSKNSQCPDLCDSIKNVRYSGEKLIGFGITACVFACIAIILSLFKFRYRNSRILNWLIYLSTFASALFYTIGVIVYKSESKFDDNFHDVKKYNGYYSDPDNFSWKGGYGLSIATLCLQWIMIFVSRLFTLKARSN